MIQFSPSACFEEVLLKEVTVALLLAHYWVCLGRCNKLLSYPFNLARARKLDSEITHKIVTRSNMGVDIYSISSRCFLPLTGRVRLVLVLSVKLCI